MPFPTPARAALGALLSTVVLAVPAAEPAEAAGCAYAAVPASSPHARGAVLCLVNGERARRGLRPLHANGRLAGVARRQARDLVRFHFVGHTSPRRGSLRRRVARSGFTRGRQGWTAGENLAMGSGRVASPRRIVRAWMASPGHRANILRRAFTSAGLGAARGMPTGGRRGRTVVMTFGG
jgi:uncharacterized protein YkwD